MNGLRVRALAAIDEATRRGLGDLLIDCVAGGASVGFMWPMTREKADAFWQGVAASLARGERAVMVAEDAHGMLVGTAQVVWAVPENQPHRADVAKMLVHPRARRMGAGAALLAAVEQAALDAGKSLLVLDTASSDAERLYERGDWRRVGTIPRYALMPDGPFCSTVFYYKDLAGKRNET
jgi:GNAT superfamily N-acetyltransferase